MYLSSFFQKVKDNLIVNHKIINFYNVLAPIWENDNNLRNFIYGRHDLPTNREKIKMGFQTHSSLRFNSRINSKSNKLTVY